GTSRFWHLGIRVRPRLLRWTTGFGCAEETWDSEGGQDEEGADPPQRLTPLERLTTEMCQYEWTIKELIVGRRIGFYKVRGAIGYGTFSRVKMAFPVLTKGKGHTVQRLLSREISCLEALQHSNVLRLYEVVESHSRLYLVMEYSGGGDLHTHICSDGRLSEAEAKITFAQILSAIKHMVSNIKLNSHIESAILSQVLIKSTCQLFVFARHPGLDTFCGSPPYAAPELFRNECYAGPPVDVWAMAVLLFFMVTGTMPFQADTMGKLRLAVIEGVYTLLPWVPGPCQRLIRGILKPVPADRYAVEQMLGCDWLLPVEYPWTVVPPVPLNPLRLADAEPGELDDDEAEIRASLEELGVNMEHIRNNQGKGSRSPITGLYRILLHHAQKRRGAETVPMIRGLVQDPKKEGLLTYRGLMHSSK
uniref:non-specific serine/threonine protein kinase n=1 Tax=Oncorhynchus mykiss TaxID=8022 RepID=A0A8C7SWP5_ONCMY